MDNVDDVPDCLFCSIYVPTFNYGHNLLVVTIEWGESGQNEFPP